MKQFIILVCLAATLSGCNSLKKLTGQSNDTILPGTREDILPPEQQTARDPVVTSKNKVACDPNKDVCPAQTPTTIQ